VKEITQSINFQEMKKHKKPTNKISEETNIAKRKSKYPSSTEDIYKKNAHT
jgi:hypothetical protein